MSHWAPPGSDIYRTTPPRHAQSKPSCRAARAAIAVLKELRLHEGASAGCIAKISGIIAREMASAPVTDDDFHTSMNKLAIVFGDVALTIGGIFFFVIFGTFIGACAGWAVGLVLGETILGVLAKFGVTGVSMWQFGAFMGFVGGYLKTKVTAEVKQAEVKQEAA